VNGLWEELTTILHLFSLAQFLGAAVQPLNGFGKGSLSSEPFGPGGLFGFLFTLGFFVVIPDLSFLLSMDAVEQTGVSFLVPSAMFPSGHALFHFNGVGYAVGDGMKDHLWETF
jgi:hypothetical protein